MPSVISLQSSVAFGHVGNSVAAFAMQRLGVDVCALPSIVLSSHKGYPDANGFAVSAYQLSGLLRGLEARGQFEQSGAVISGYMGSIDAAKIWHDCLTRHPQCHYVLDPVMGDTGIGVFVDPALPDFFKQALLPRAAWVTPNLFELELLSGHKITSLEQVIDAARSLFAHGPKNCVVTSLRLPELEGQVGNLLIGPAQSHLVRTSMINQRFNGTGDLFTALLAARLLNGCSHVEALERATASVFDIASATHEKGGVELSLIANQDRLLTPKTVVKASRVD